MREQPQRYETGQMRVPPGETFPSHQGCCEFLYELRDPRPHAIATLLKHCERGPPCGSVWGGMAIYA